MSDLWVFLASFFLSFFVGEGGKARYGYLDPQDSINKGSSPQRFGAITHVSE